LTKSKECATIKGDDLMEKDYKKIIGKNVKAKREAMGLTKVALANICNVTDGQIASIEKGRAYPGIETLIKLKEALKTDFNYFFNVHEYNDEELFEEELLSLYRLLPKKDKDKLREMALLQKKVNEVMDEFR
jgi:transcriptional regulator with XRE-family HTH domain